MFTAWPLVTIVSGGHRPLVVRALTNSSTHVCTYHQSRIPFCSPRSTSAVAPRRLDRILGGIPLCFRRFVRTSIMDTHQSPTSTCVCFREAPFLIKSEKVVTEKSTTACGWLNTPRPSRPSLLKLPSVGYSTIVPSATKRNYDQNSSKTIPCCDTVYTAVIVSGASPSFQAASTTKQTTYNTAKRSLYNSKEKTAIRL